MVLPIPPRMTMTTKVMDCMKPNPVTIDGNELASAALEQMEQRKITSIFISGASGRVEGIIHLHDLWGLELF